MARSAYILKTLKAPEYEAVRSNFEKWAVYTTQAYLLPIDERHPLPDTKPELANNWELKHVSNRTMVGLEATIHVARLVGNRRWYRSAVDKYQRLICWKDFRAPRDEPGCGTTFFVNGQGENNDHYRGDPWHRTAGLASCLQICEIVKSDTGEDMFHREGDILKKSLEYYANILDPERGVPIPTWDLAARTFPDSQAIQSVALRQKAHETPSSIGTIIQYSWGLSDLLNIQGGKTQYKPGLPQRASRVSR